MQKLTRSYSPKSKKVMDPILYNAAMEGNTGDGDFLLADYLNRDEENGYQVIPKGNTVLHIAALYGQSANKGHQEVVEVLLRGVDVDGQAVGINKETLMRMTDDGGDTALHKAVRTVCVDTVRLLVEQDPDFEFPANNAGRHHSIWPRCLVLSTVCLKS
ncbi:hypothetical protein BC332_14116 [Capsicum chinense]|nr:hypothetical protein BC332_14116 [Capsicum chinense]